MHVHILGICGTFMAGIATLARARGHVVTGSDASAYPPMSDVLAAQGIAVGSGYDEAHLDPAPDCVIVGNAMTRGNPVVEAVLDRGLAFTSGPQWLAEHVLRGRDVIAVAGTHGKTTTTSLIASILVRTGRDPGFLVGGVAPDLGDSARLGAADAPFVLEADEYDSALFDKRSKFVHYGPHARVLVINGIEFDHADIFDDLGAIRRQFHHLVRTLPRRAEVLALTPDPEVDAVLDLGCWSRVRRFGVDAGDWKAHLATLDGSRLTVHRDGADGTIEWGLIGRHNATNAVAAVAAAHAVGVSVSEACTALGSFAGVRRRLELRAEIDGIRVYDDFAHHPSAIEATLGALRAHVGAERILAIVDPASNTMRMGVHRDTLAGALRGADAVWIHRADALSWHIGADDLPALREAVELEAIVASCARSARPGDHVVVMSNGGFGAAIHAPLAAALRQRRA